MPTSIITTSLQASNTLTLVVYVCVSCDAHAQIGQTSDTMEHKVASLIRHGHQHRSRFTIRSRQDMSADISKMCGQVGSVGSPLSLGLESIDPRTSLLLRLKRLELLAERGSQHFLRVPVVLALTPVHLRRGRTRFARAAGPTGSALSPALRAIARLGLAPRPLHPALQLRRVVRLSLLVRERVLSFAEAVLPVVRQTVMSIMEITRHSI